VKKEITKKLLESDAAWVFPQAGNGAHPEGLALDWLLGKIQSGSNE